MKRMTRETLAKLVGALLSHNGGCNVSVDIWYPTVREIKYILGLGEHVIDPNNEKDTCSIFGILFDKYACSKSPAFRCIIFCKDAEAKFMREYTKKRKEVNK